MSRAERQAIATAKSQVMLGMVMITGRPPEAEERAVPGHWEGDLIIAGANRSAIICRGGADVHHDGALPNPHRGHRQGAVLKTPERGVGMDDLAARPLGQVHKLCYTSHTYGLWLGVGGDQLSTPESRPEDPKDQSLRKGRTDLRQLSNQGRALTNHLSHHRTGR